MALLLLDLMEHQQDEGVAGHLADPDEIAAGALYLLGVAVRALSAQRQESATATTRFLRQLVEGGEGGGDGLGGVREPRRPHPSPGGATAQADRG
jgi:hypothetical protein